MNLIYLDDIVYNRKNTKGLFIIIFFRISNFCASYKILKVFGFPIRVLYRVIVVWLLGCDLPDKTHVGRALRIYHGQGLVVNKDVLIGDYVTLRQNTTIGNAKSGQKSPTLEDFADIGANSVIIGDICVGRSAVVGAGSVVLKNVPSNSVVVGNPAVVKKISTV